MILFSRFWDENISVDLEDGSKALWLTYNRQAYIPFFHLLHRERKEYDSKNRKVENIYFLINLFYYEEEVY